MVVATVALPIVQLAAPAQRAHADNGLRVESTTTYTVDPTAGVVRVRAEMDFTNTAPDTKNGSVIKRTYFSGFSIPAPASATNPSATTSGGTSLRISAQPVGDGSSYILYDIDFASDLFLRQTTSVVVTYDIAGLPPRSSDPSRVNPAYVAFNAFGIGTDGQVAVRVVVPEGFEIDTFGADAAVSKEGGNTVYTATDIPNPNEFTLFVSARNDRRLADKVVSTSDGDDFRLRSWPNDPEWATFVEEQIGTGVPALADLIGTPWPIDGEVEVREAYTPYLYGYAGWFSTKDKEIEIGEDLDQEVVLHELSHAWFDSQWFEDRWLNEGFAQAYASLAGVRLGGAPSSPESIPADDPGQVALNAWGNPDLDNGADQMEPFGYNASWWVVQQLLDEVGTYTMREVLAAVDAGTIAYAGAGEPEATSAVTDWRRFLDLMEELGGSEKAAALIETYVATPDQVGQLADRAEARTRYQALRQAEGTWAPPLAVRTRMASWKFADARELIDDASAVLALRDELDAKATSLGSPAPATLEPLYEAADKDLSAAELAVRDQLDAADALLAAAQLDATDDGLLASIGLIGADVSNMLAEGRAAFSAGDTDLARTRAQQVTDTVERASDVGRQRALVALASVVLLIALAASTVTLLRRQRRNEVLLDTPTPEAD